jgi:hypothetical protein
MCASGTSGATSYAESFVGCGTIFKLSRSTGDQWTEAVLYRRTRGLDGGYPVGGAIFDDTGKLHRTALHCGCKLLRHRISIHAVTGKSVGTGLLL